MDVINLPLAQTITYARNLRSNEGAIATISASLAKFGWRQPIVVDEAIVILVGHTRLAPSCMTRVLRRALMAPDNPGGDPGRAAGTGGDAAAAAGTVCP